MEYVRRDMEETFIRASDQFKVVVENTKTIQDSSGRAFDTRTIYTDESS